MKFYAPTNDPIHIALLTGQTALVTKEGNELGKQFYREAMALGCLTEPVETAKEDNPFEEEYDEEEFVEAAPIERKTAIKNAINDMLNGTVEDDFKADGTPDLRKLSSRTGFRVSKEEMSEVFTGLTS